MLGGGDTTGIGVGWTLLAAKCKIKGLKKREAKLLERFLKFLSYHNNVLDIVNAEKSMASTSIGAITTCLSVFLSRTSF